MSGNRRRGLNAPALLPFEVSNVLRRKWAQGGLALAAAESALASFAEIPIALWPWEALAPTIWNLRGGCTAYDSAYVALAQLIGAALVTCDKGMVKAAQGRCPARFLDQRR
ncbi:MAG: type II toxin-antitoxin system VapC family toxin [Bifidobacteriaceae bacterium]|jgi:predicted nucleic acid-binding protein|nr:type II toxin-antitoxin system VapC family toxin [Bifidobacteriaceae bacterium]